MLSQQLQNVFLQQQQQQQAAAAAAVAARNTNSPTSQKSASDLMANRYVITLKRDVMLYHVTSHSQATSLQTNPLLYQATHKTKLTPPLQYQTNPSSAIPN